MRRTLICGAIAAGALLTALSIDAGTAAQAWRGGYCAIFYWHTTDCGYYTARQCLEAIDGVGGHCTRGLNGPPIFVDDDPYDRPRKRRARRYRY